MKNETNGQLVAVLVGVVIALAISLVPGLSSGAKWGLVACVAVLSHMVTKKKSVKGGLPGSR